MPNQQGVVPALPDLIVSPVGRATSQRWPVSSVQCPPPLIAQQRVFDGREHMSSVGKTASEGGRQADARPFHCLGLLGVPRTLRAWGCTSCSRSA